MKHLKLKLKLRKILFEYYLIADDIIDNGEELPEYLVFHYEGHYTGLITRMLTALGWLDYALKNKRKLLMFLTDKTVDTSNDNIWNCFFLQPMSAINYTYEEIEEMIKKGNALKLPKGTRYHYKFDKRFRGIMKLFPPKIWFPTPDDYRNRPTIHERYKLLYKDYIHFTDDVKNYLEKEYNTVLKGKGTILGIKLRGTDYVQQKPYNHPVQPSSKEIIDYIKTMPANLKWDYIYLATEEKAIEDEFTLAFPGKILINQRHYYDGDYSNRVLSDEQVNIGGTFNQDLEYLSSIYLLSKCDMLVSGMSGGTEAAMIMKEGDYTHLYIFEKGNYGVGKNK